MSRKHKGGRFRRNTQKQKPGVPQAGAPQKQESKSTYNSYIWCNHWREPVMLDGGLSILASAYSDRPKSGWYGPARDTLSVYLDSMWLDRGTIVGTAGIDLPFTHGKHRYVMYPWADMSVPDDVQEFRLLVEWMLDKIKQGVRVETGCFGGHGRTGTLLACLMVAQGVPAADAVARVRYKYCEDAIETGLQVDFIVEFDLLMNNRSPSHEDVLRLERFRSLSIKGSGVYTYKRTVVNGVEKWERFDDPEPPQPNYIRGSYPTSADVERAETLKSLGVEAQDTQAMLDRWLQEAEERDLDPEQTTYSKRGGWWGKRPDGTVGWNFQPNEGSETYSQRSAAMKQALNDDLCMFPPCRYADQCEPNDTNGCHAEQVANEVGRWVDQEDF